MIDLYRVKWFFSHPYTVTTVFFCFFIGVYVYFYTQTAFYQTSEANKNYFEAESATTIAARKSGFNKTLDSYLNMEKRYDPRFGNGKLYYNIGNTYFQLKEYPLAALYYYRARSLRPLDSFVENNLNTTLEKLQLPLAKEKSALANVFFFHTRLPLPMRLQIFFFLAFSSVVFISINIWRPTKNVRNASIALISISIILFLSLMYTYFLENPQAVVVKSTAMYRGAGKQFAMVVDSPLKAGSRVVLLESDQGGTWLKVEDDDKGIGFVPHASLRVIF